MRQQSPAAREWAIECEGLTRSFGDVLAVDGIDLAVPAGSIFGFLGPNGAGKTTTIRLLLGLLRPSAGVVRVFSHDLPARAEAIRMRTGTVLEHHGLYDGLSVRANLEFAAQAYGLNRVGAARRVAAVAERFDLAARLDERPQALSRGLRQRFAVVRALVGDPDLLVLDEPTNGLDAEAAAGLRDQILALAGSGTTVFLSTHLLAEAERLCDLVAVVKGGRVIACDTPATLRRRSQVTQVHIEGPGLERFAAAVGDLVAAATIDMLVVEVDGLEAVPAVVSTLAAAGAAIHRVEPQGQTLEAAFLSLVAEGRDDPVAEQTERALS